jgi:hypothetical protein
MATEENLDEPGITLAQAIALLRSELLSAREEGEGSQIQLPVESMTVVLQVAATRTAGGKAGFSVPLVNLQLGGSAGWQHETLQTVTVVFGAPVDRLGNPVEIAGASNELKG